MTTIKSYISRDIILKQAKKVRRKKSCGIDGVPAKEAVNIAVMEYPSIIKEVTSGEYRPSYIKKILIPKGNGKVRIIGSATVIDRIIQGCIHNYLYEKIDDKMSENSFGFRNGYNCQMAVLKVKEHIANGYEWIISIDLKDCFNNLDKDLMLWLLKNEGVDEITIKIINKIISNKYVYKNNIEPVKGCPQGSNISPDLCNLVLNQLDEMVNKRNHPFVRYADDIYIFCKSEKSAQRTMLSVVQYLQDKLKLEVNKDKSCIFHSKSKIWSCLGFLIKHEKEIQIHVNPRKTEKLRISIKEKLNEKRNPEEIIKDLNALTTSWISSNAIAKISNITKSLDSFIKRNISKYERKYRVKIDTHNLCNCHDYYKNVTQHNIVNYVGNPKEPTHKELTKNIDELNSARAPP